MNFGIWWCFLAAAAVCSAEKWQWPDTAASVKIDTKVRFTDGESHDSSNHGLHTQADEDPFHQADDTAGFYNRGGGGGRYPVRVKTHPRADTRSIYSLHSSKNYQSDGTLDSLQYCKCVSSPDCNPRTDSDHACGSGKFLCCYKRPNKVNPQRTEYFNEVEDERPSLLPGQQKFASPFPAPPAHAGLDDMFVARQPPPGGLHETDYPGLLVGPGGPTGNVGSPGLLVGPGGPTGNVGTAGLLVGPEGPTGVVGPVRQPNRNNVLVGPDGPTGVIGPAPVDYNKGIVVGPNGPREINPSETAQRGVLVGPGGPTGVIGPRGYGQRPVLVGPGGPTGIIGPRMRQYFSRYLGQQRPGVLVGPGGPTGMIGPARQLLVGPGGPTGQIGPMNYFSY